MDDASLAARAADGEVAAFELLIRRHLNTVWRAAVATSRDHARAERAVRDAFLDAYAALGTYPADGPVWTWLVSTCVRDDEVHDDVAAVLVSDEPVPAEFAEHLADCDACIAFARRYEQVRRAGPPPWLADSIVAAVESAPLPVVVPSPKRPIGERLLIRVAAGVAATLAVAVGAFALRADSPSPAVTLGAAAQRTHDSRSAALRVTGTTVVLPDRRTTVRADGDVKFGDRLQLTGTVDGETFDLVAGDGVAIRRDGRWALAVDSSGPWLAVLGGPDNLVLLLQDATDVTIEGSEYRFRVATFTGSATVDDGRLSTVRLSATGVDGPAWLTDIRVEFSRHGTAVAPAPVDPGTVRDRVPPPGDQSLAFYPFTP